jgi:hypothetical protein
MHKPSHVEFLSSSGGAGVPAALRDVIGAVAEFMVRMLHGKLAAVHV